MVVSPELCALGLPHSLSAPEASEKNSTLNPSATKNTGKMTDSKVTWFKPYFKVRILSTTFQTQSHPVLKQQPILLLNYEESSFPQRAEICAPIPTPTASLSFKKKKYIHSFPLLNSPSNICRTFSWFLSDEFNQKVIRLYFENIRASSKKEASIKLSFNKWRKVQVRRHCPRQHSNPWWVSLS